MARAARLWAVAAALLGVLLPALGQGSWPAQVVDTAPSGTCSTNTYKGAVVDRNTADLWRCLDLDGNGTANWTSSRVARYQDLDTNADGVTDHRIVGDYDGDGTLELADIQGALCTLQGMTVGSTGDGTGCTGSPNSGGKTLIVLPGTYTGGYLTTLTISAPNMTLMGSGRDSTKIDITADSCTGTGALDDNDGTAEARYVVLISDDANGATVRDLWIDGNSNLHTYLAQKLYYYWDIDRDGTDNQLDPTPGRDCANWWVSDISNGIAWVDAAPVTVTGNRVENFARVAIANDSESGAVNSGTVTISNNVISGSAEHGIVCGSGDAMITNNTIRNSTHGGGSAILLGAYPGRSQIVTGNSIEDVPGYGIWRERDGYASPGALQEVVVSNNRVTVSGLSLSGHDTTKWGGACIMFSGDTTGPEYSENVTISGNVCKLDGDYQIRGLAFYGSSSASSSRIAVTANQISWSAQTRAENEPHTSMYYYYVEDAAIAGNTIETYSLASGSTHYGVNIDTSKRFTLTSNMIHSSNLTSRGVQVTGGSYDWNVTGNNIECTYDGTATTDDPVGMIVLGSSLRGSITGNMFNGSTAGLWISSGSDISITGNTFTRVQTGLRVSSGVSRLFVSDNSFLYSGPVDFNGDGTNNAYSWSWMINDSNTSGQNFYQNNMHLKGYSDSNAPGSLRNADSHVSLVWETDENSDGSIDDPVWHRYGDRTGINLDDDGNAIRFRSTSGLFVGTCGANECLVYDVDASNGISSADSCLLESGPDPDCDGVMSMCQLGDNGCGTFAFALDRDQTNTNPYLKPGSGTGYYSLESDPNEDGSPAFRHIVRTSAPTGDFLYLYSNAASCTAGGSCTGYDWYICSNAANGLCVCDGSTWVCPGTGDVTAVGPACSGGACFTDNVATTGATITMFDFEGSTVDSYEFKIQAPSADPTADYIATFPAKQGTVVLSAASSQPTSQCATWDSNGLLDGTGSACGGTGSSPGGSNTYVQFNNSGAFGGASNLTYDNATGQTTAVTLSNQQVNNNDVNGWLWKIGSVTNANWKVQGTQITNEGATEDAYETTLTFADPTSDRTVTVPNASGTVQLRAASCTLGGATSEAAGQQCFDATYGVLVSDGSNWYTANWSQNNSGEVWYSGTNYEPTSEAAFAYNASTNTLTVTNVSGNASTSTALAADPTDCSTGNVATTIAASGNLACKAETLGSFTFSFSNLPASGTSNMRPAGVYGDAFTRWYTPYAITLTGMTCYVNASKTGGTLAVTVQNAGSNTDITRDTSTTWTLNTPYSDTACTSSCSVSADSYVNMTAVTASTFAPTTADIQCQVFYKF